MLDTFDAGAEQPRPSKGEQDVVSAVQQDFADMDIMPMGATYKSLCGLAIRLRMAIAFGDEGHKGRQPAQMVIDDLEARAKAGEAKYGSRLRTNNGRKAIVDLYQEVLDAINYYKQAVLERRL